MMAVEPLELARQQAQNALDHAKGQRERNRLGQFATPASLAADILAYAGRLVPADAKVRFLDPAFGTGSFYSALLSAFPSSRVECAVGYELDSSYADAALALWAETGLHLHVADFTRVVPPVVDGVRPNLLICNPPYVRHHHIDPADKQRLCSMVQRVTGIRLSGLSGLYCYFMLCCHAWMAEGGIAGWLVPSEFMDVNYGQQVRRYLLDHVTLLRVHRFRPDDVQFDDALVSSAVVWIQRRSPPQCHDVELSYGGSLDCPTYRRRVSSDELRAMSKWSILSDGEPPAPTVETPRRLADLFTIKRGIATGANGFFIFPEQEARRRGIPSEFLVPILPSPRYLDTDEIGADENGVPTLTRRLFLLSCSLPPAHVEGRYPKLWAYLQTGIVAGIADRYLARHRNPWYSQEMRPPAPLLCSYMGRGDGKGGSPFRFILNHSRATVPNVYLMLYPKPSLDRALARDPLLLRAVWSALNDIPAGVLVREGRVYGGGLHKMEPGELGNAPAEAVIRVVGDGMAEHLSQLSLW